MLCLFLTFALVNLSLQAWSSDALMIEVSEEQEEALEDVNESETYLTDEGHNDIVEEEFNSFTDEHGDEFATASDHFEIDSPPPEL